MRRRSILAAIVACVAALCLTACNSVLGIGADSFSDRTTIIWLVRTDPAVNSWEKSAVKEFERTHPDIHVQLVISPGSKDYDQKYVTMVVGDEAPDVFSTWGENGWADDVHEGFVKDLTPFVNADRSILHGVDKKALAQYSLDGRILGLPSNVGGTYLFYNVDMFRKAHLPLPPSSWDDKSWTIEKALQDARKLTDPDTDTYGLNMEIGPDSQAQLFGGWIIPKQAYRTGIPKSFDTSSEAVVKSQQWMASLIHKEKVAPTPAKSTALNAFMSGKIGMDATGWWGITTYRQAGFHWAIAPLPRAATNIDTTYTDVWMMSQRSRHPKQAWELIKWLMSPEHGAKGYMEASGAAPANSALRSAWLDSVHKAVPSMSTRQIAQLLDGSLKNGVESYLHTLIGAGHYNLAMTNVSALIYQQNADVEPTLKELDKQLEAIRRDTGDVKPLR